MEAYLPVPWTVCCMKGCPLEDRGAHEKHSLDATKNHPSGNNKDPQSCRFSANE